MTTTQYTMLNVSYDNKEYAKQAGAKWNPTKKSWYIETNKYVEYTKTYKKLKQEKENEEKNEREQKAQNTKIYIDDNDVYMREYAEYDKKGFYLTFDKLKNNVKINDNLSPDIYYICPTAMLFKDNIRDMAGVKTYKYKAYETRDKTFNYSKIPGCCGDTYYVVNSRIKHIFNILTHNCTTPNLGLLFDACLSNNDIIIHLTKDKIRAPYVVSNSYNIFDKMQRKYYKIYKTFVINKLNKHFYKDLSKIINDYLIQYINIPEITRVEYEKTIL